MSNELKPLHFDADYTMEEALAEAALFELS